MPSRVFWIRESLDDDRPSVVTYSDPTGRYQTSEGYQECVVNANVSAGTPGYSSDRWTAPELVASERGSTSINEWDYYMFSGSFGLLSNKAINVMKIFLGNRFEFLPTTLEGLTYHCLRCCHRIDCLDRKRSHITFYEDSEDVMQITSHVFLLDRLKAPMIFAIPELQFDLFCTGSVMKIMDPSELKGFDFELVFERSDSASNQG